MGRMCCDDEMIVFAKKPKEADNNVSDFFDVNTSATILIENIHDDNNGHDNCRNGGNDHDDDNRDLSL